MMKKWDTIFFCRFENHFRGNLVLMKMTLIMSWTKPTDYQSTQLNRPGTITHWTLCKFRTHCFKEQLYSQKKKIHRSANRKINFHVSLTKHCSILLKEANNYIKNDERIKFYFPDSNGNLKVKFADNHNVNFDTFQSFLTVLERKLGSDENAYEGDNNAETTEVEQ